MNNNWWYAWALTEWEILPGSPWYFPALCMIALLNAFAFYYLVKIIKNNEDEIWLFKLGAALWLTALISGSTAPFFGVMNQVGPKNIMGSLGAAIVMYCLAYDIVRLKISKGAGAPATPEKGFKTCRVSVARKV